MTESKDMKENKPLCQFCNKPSSNSRLQTSQCRPDLEICWACKQYEKRSGKLVLPEERVRKKRKKSSGKKKKKRKLSNSQAKNLRAMLESESEESEDSDEVPEADASESFTKMSVKVEDAIVWPQKKKAPKLTTPEKRTSKEVSMKPIKMEKIVGNSKEKTSTPKRNKSATSEKSDQIAKAPTAKKDKASVKRERTVSKQAKVKSNSVRHNSVVTELRVELGNVCAKVEAEMKRKDQKILGLEKALSKKTQDGAALVKRMKEKVEKMKQIFAKDIEEEKEKHKCEVQRLVKEKLDLAMRLESALTENLILNREIDKLTESAKKTLIPKKQTSRQTAANFQKIGKKTLIPKKQ